MRSIITVISLSLLLWGRAHAQQPQFGDRVDRGVVNTSLLAEISGAVSSSLNPHCLWVHNDSGNENCLYALDTRTAAVIAVYRIAGVANHDWEDIAAGPGPEQGVSYLYVADIGDNDMKRPVKQIVRFPEPRLTAGSPAEMKIVRGADIISFKYPDGCHDAETLLLDPLSRDMYIVSKTSRDAVLYRLSFPQNTDRVIAAEKCGAVHLPQATAGSVTRDGSGIVIKNYFSLFYWRRDAGSTLFQALGAAPVILPYIPEPQGEAVCWDRDGKGLFTLSEQKANMPVHLFYYPPRGLE